MKPYNKIIINFKCLIAGLLCNEFTGGFVRLCFRKGFHVHGARIKVPIYLQKKVDAQIFFGFYEKSEQSMVRKYLNRECNVIELGSSLGVVSSQIARKLSPRSTLLCVEANENLIESLAENLSNSEATCKTIIRNALVGDEKIDRIRFRIGDEHVSSRFELCDDLAVVSHCGRPGPKLLNLSSLLEELPPGPYSLVSDIEGAEFFFLSQVDSLANCHQLIIELHDVEVLGVTIKICDMIDMIQDKHKMRLVEADYPVFLFESDQYTSSISKK